MPSARKILRIADRLINLDDGVRGNAHYRRPGAQFDRVAQYELGESCYASPAISDGQVFLRGFQHLFCLGRQTN